MVQIPMSATTPNSKSQDGLPVCSAPSSNPQSAGLDEWVKTLLADNQMLLMGHDQRLEDLNLGMGWLYYALVRLVRPTQVVVIGSWRGFTPLIFAKAMADNTEGGRVTFIDPSRVDEMWKNPATVAQRFSNFGVDNIQHYCMTTQEFVETEAYQSLGEVGIVFIDGDHTAAQASFDFFAFADKVPSHGMILLHDSVEMKVSSIYGNENSYCRTVKLFVDQLKQDPSLQVLDLPFCHGLTLVRRCDVESR